MSDSPEVLTTARQRATTAGLPYAGALTPAEAWVLLQSDPRCRLVDVRSRAEWEFVGRVPGALEIEWKSWPGMVPNAGFVDALREAVGGIEAPRLLSCAAAARVPTTRRWRPALPGWANASTCSKASRATAMPSSIATRSGAGARPACRGPRAEAPVAQAKYARTISPRAIRYQPKTA